MLTAGLLFRAGGDARTTAGLESGATRGGLAQDDAPKNYISFFEDWKTVMRSSAGIVAGTSHSC
jgi:hypothetical protein